MHHVVVLGIVVGDGEHTCQRVLVVVAEDAGVVVVCGFHTCCHRLFVAFESSLEQLLRPLQGLGHRFPASGFHRIHHFPSHFAVGNVALVLAPVVGEVTQMDQYGKHIVLAANLVHVVAETSGVHLTSFACQHADDIVLQTLIVHLDVADHGIVCTRRSPETAATSTVQSHHHRIRIKHRFFVANLIAIIPFHHFIEIHVVFLGKSAHLIFSKTKITSHTDRFHHGVFHEVVECRLRVVFLDGQDTCHIDPCEDIVGVDRLEHAPQPVDVVVHGCGARVELAADGVPLVDDEEKGVARGCMHFQ